VTSSSGPISAPPPPPGTRRRSGTCRGPHTTSTLVRRGYRGTQFPLRSFPGCEAAGRDQRPLYEERRGAGEWRAATRWSWRRAFLPDTASPVSRATIRFGSSRASSAETANGGARKNARARSPSDPQAARLSFVAERGPPLDMLTALAHARRPRAAPSGRDDPGCTPAARGRQRRQSRSRGSGNAGTIYTTVATARKRPGPGPSAPTRRFSIAKSTLSRAAAVDEQRGVDIVVEHVGAETSSAPSVRSQKGGRLVTCGATTGGEVTAQPYASSSSSSSRSSAQPWAASRAP